MEFPRRTNQGAMNEIFFSRKSRITPYMDQTEIKFGVESAKSCYQKIQSFQKTIVFCPDKSKRSFTRNLLLAFVNDPRIARIAPRFHDWAFFSISLTKHENEGFFSLLYVPFFRF